MQKQCSVLNYTCMTFSFSKRRNKWRNSCPRRCLCIVVCLCSCSSQRLQERKQSKGRRRENMWGSLCPWGRWGAKGTWSKGSDLESKTSVLANKTSLNGLSSCFFFFSHLIDLNFHLFHLSWSPQSLTQCHSHTGGGFAIYTEMSRAFSFTRIHHFVGFNQKKNNPMSLIVIIIKSCFILSFYGEKFSSQCFLVLWLNATHSVC